MGPPLKGKKAWRKNIDASEVERFLEDASHQERRGPAVESLPDSELFFVDKAADTDAAQQLALGQRRRKPRQTQLQLRSTAILEQAHKAQPVVPQKPPRKVNTVLKKAEPAARQQRRPRFAPVAAAELDIWGGAPLVSSTTAASASDAALAVLPEHPAAVIGAAAAHARRKLRPKLLPSKVQAVDVDAAGCSYNPEREAHQDALALLVASEMKKVLQQDFERKGPSRMVEVEPEDFTLDEISRLQVEASPDEDDANEDHLSDEDGDGSTAAGRSRSDKKTRKDRNRDKRRTDQEKESEERQRLKRQRRELDQLSQLEQELQELHEQQELKRQRRQAVKSEKEATLPGRLSKHKFEPPSLQVATSNELSGSLRRVKPCAMVALHRYKSLQQRGLIEPRKVVVPKRVKRVEYEKGLRTERALAGQAEVEAMQKARRLVAKQTKKAKKAGAIQAE